TRSNDATRANPVRRAKLALQHLARGVARQLLDELDGARALEARGPLRDEGEELGLIPLPTGEGLAYGLDLLSPVRVGDAEHRGVEHRRVLAERLLDLGGVDVDPTRDDHVLLSIEDI